MLHLSRKVRSIRSSITIVKGFVLVAMISALVVVASSYVAGALPFGTVRASETMTMMQGDPAPTPPQRAGCDASRPKEDNFVCDQDGETPKTLSDRPVQAQLNSPAVAPVFDNSPVDPATIFPVFTLRKLAAFELEATFRKQGMSALECDCGF